MTNEKIAKGICARIGREFNERHWNGPKNFEEIKAALDAKDAEIAALKEKISQLVSDEAEMKPIYDRLQKENQALSSQVKVMRGKLEACHALFKSLESTAKRNDGDAFYVQIAASGLIVVEEALAALQAPTSPTEGGRNRADLLQIVIEDVPHQYQKRLLEKLK